MARAAVLDRDKEASENLEMRNAEADIACSFRQRDWPANKSR